MTYKHTFAAAIAAAALFAFMHSPSAQEAKKDKADQQQAKKEKSAKGGDDARRASRIAQADIAEVAAGKLGASKASSDEVKKFAQHMVDDHGKHLNELRSMAKSKNMTLPTAPDKKHQDAMKKLESAKGEDFDRQFMAMMVKDHQDALKLAQDTAKNAQDPDLKADAEKTSKVIQQHLDEAKKIASSLKK